LPSAPKFLCLMLISLDSAGEGPEAYTLKCLVDYGLRIHCEVGKGREMERGALKTNRDELVKRRRGDNSILWLGRGGREKFTQKKRKTGGFVSAVLCISSGVIAVFGETCD